MKILDKVKAVLANYPETRDSDAKRMMEIYEDESSVYDLFIKIHEKKLPSTESISRARRKIQEENIDLRGNRHGDRQQRADHVRTHIKYNGNQALMQI